MAQGADSTRVADLDAYRARRRRLCRPEAAPGCWLPAWAIVGWHVDVWEAAR